MYLSELDGFLYVPSTTVVLSVSVSFFCGTFTNSIPTTQICMLLPDAISSAIVRVLLLFSNLLKLSTLSVTVSLPLAL